MLSNPDSGVRQNQESARKFSLVELGLQGLGIRNPANDWNPKSKFHRHGMQFPGIGNPGRGIQNPTLSWITLHGSDISPPALFMLFLQPGRLLSPFISYSVQLT